MANSRLKKKKDIRKMKDYITLMILLLMMNGLLRRMKQIQV